MRGLDTLILLLFVLSAVGASPVHGGELPVRNPADEGWTPVSSGVRNPLSLRQIRRITGVSEDGGAFVLDLGDPRYHGYIHAGPYPFETAESDYDYPRYRVSSSLTDGRGMIQVSRFFRDKYNANDWPSDTMAVAYRLELYRAQGDGHCRPVGFCDGKVAFELSGPTVGSGIARKVTIVEGPFLSLKRSDQPDQVMVAWETDEPCTGTVYLSGPVEPGSGPPPFEVAAGSAAGTRHEALVGGLLPDREYRYYVECDGTRSPGYTFRSAPRRGEGEVCFAFASDSREGVGGGERNYMGHNLYMNSRLAQDAYRRGAEFLIFGGDLVNGYTTETEDFALQLKGWKQGLSGFWRSRPVYPAMGNHETLLNTFVKGLQRLRMDKWPYASDSAEAVFAREFWNPANGPKPADPRRPAYGENVYSFQYGPVLCVAFNNNYWWSTNRLCERFGGCPEGYIMEDQLQWIERTLAEAERDPTVRFVVLYAQEPVFPCGGHVGDAMWWGGDNNLRAHSRQGQRMLPESTGMIEARNRFWSAVSGCRKAAAVLAGDEHEYHRLLLSTSNRWYSCSSPAST
ncbi:MAG: metallophosphoesterase, partial [Candidatus Brocadiia bacterium]